jgi:hypothetical protein
VLGDVLRDAGQLSGADSAYRATLTIRRAVVGTHDPVAVGAALALADVLVDEGRPAEAATLARDARAAYVPLGLPNDTTPRRIERVLGAALAGLGRDAEAEPLLVDAARAWEADTSTSWRTQRSRAASQQRLAGWRARRRSPGN